MNDFKEFLYDNKTIAVLAGLLIAFGGWVTGRKLKISETGKSDAEKDSIRVMTKITLDKYEEEKEMKYRQRIEALESKIAQMAEQISKFKNLYDEAIVMIESLQAEKNLLITIKS